MDRGAKVSVELTSSHYRQSTLVQGGIEIPFKVMANLPGNLLWSKYKQLIHELYAEPKSEEILGSFLELVGEKASAVSNKKKGEKTKKS